MYYENFDLIPDDTLRKADEYICKLLNVECDEFTYNDHTLDAVKWINGNIGLDDTDEYLDDQCSQYLAKKGLIETNYTAKAWCKNNNVKISRNDNGKLNDNGRLIYSAAIVVNGKVIDNNFTIGPGLGDNIDDILQDSILSFLHYFSEDQYYKPIEQYKDNDEYENIKLAYDFCAALSESARHEFINGYIEYRE